MKRELYLMLYNQAMADRSKALLSLDLLGNHPAGIGDHSTTDFYNNANNSVMARFQVDTGYIATHCGNSERMRIDSSGSLGLGTNNPGSLLHVAHSNGGANPTARIENAKRGIASNKTKTATEIHKKGISYY